MKKRYRIVTDNYAGYEVQAWRWCLPLWLQVSEVEFGVNTFLSIKDAQEFIDNKKRGIIVGKREVVWRDY